MIGQERHQIECGVCRVATCMSVCYTAAAERCRSLSITLTHTAPAQLQFGQYALHAGQTDGQTDRLVHRCRFGICNTLLVKNAMSLVSIM